MDFTSGQLYYGGIGAVALTILALTSASNQKRLTRSGFLMTLVFVAALTFIGWELTEVLSDRSDQARSFLEVMWKGVGPLLYFLLVRWSVFRLQNIGWSRWWALLTIVIWPLLLIWPGRWDPSLTS